MAIYSGFKLLFFYCKYKQPETIPRKRLIKSSEDYCWSDIQAYYGRPEKPVGLTDIDFILGIFAEEQTETIRRFHEHIKVIEGATQR
jgi:regulator of extracellular matrix RemA (YlzA/DUF370 family)